MTERRYTRPAAQKANAAIRTDAEIDALADGTELTNVRITAEAAILDDEVEPSRSRETKRRRKLTSKSNDDTLGPGVMNGSAIAVDLLKDLKTEAVVTRPAGTNIDSMPVEVLASIV
ncbi:hypothetical protein HDU93_001810, partial [Gonapodya sp. JEL0774]